MNGSISGTSIQDLHMKQNIDQYENLRRLNQMQQMQYGTMQNHQREQGHNAAHHVQQAQHIPYYDMENTHDYPQYLHRPTAQTGFNSNMMKPAYPDIEDLARDISDNLPDDSYVTGATGISETGEAEEHFGKTKGGLLAPIPEKLREPLIIFVLFVILSQPFIKNTIGRYVKQINPDREGKVPLTGVIIYGALLAALFALSKKFLLR